MYKRQTLGSLIWVGLLTYSGYLFGENYLIIETYLDQIKYVIKPILILIFSYFFIKIFIRFLKKSKRWFDKYGVSLVFWGRLVPGIRTLISVPAGIELMPLRKFLLWTTFGSLIWVALLTYAGYLFGENYPVIETYLDQIKYVIKPILILIFLYFFIKILFRFLKKNRA